MLHSLITLLLLAAPLAATTTQSQQTEESMHRLISATQLKSWYDQNKEMVILDARSKPYFDGNLLPKARWLSAESTDQEILSAVPSKNGLIVVYCWSTECPASGWLYDKLVKLGYANIYEYHGGIQEWKQLGYTTVKQ